MSLQIKILVMIAVICLIWGQVNMVRKKKLNLKYAFPWLFLAVGVGIFTLCSPLTSMLARALGVEIPSNMIFFLGFCFSLTIIFCLTMAVSGLSGKVKKLTQECALLAKEVEQLSEIIRGKHKDGE